MTSFAQDIPGDGQAESNEDSVVVKPAFLSAVSVSADIGKLITGRLSGFEDKEVYSVHVNFLDKLRLSAEYGRATITPADAFRNIEYRTEGIFYNYGLSYVISPKAGNYLSIGVRKSEGEYKDNGTVIIISDSDLSGDYTRTFSRPLQKASWYEIVLSSETRVFKEKTSRKNNALNNFLDNFYLGTNFRLRFALDYVAQNDPDTYAIPGYGRTFDNTVPVINLFLKYKIGF